MLAPRAVKVGELQRSADARAVALVSLGSLLSTGRVAADDFDAQAEAARLPGRDRAFAFNLVVTTLRRLGQIDTVIRRLVDRPIPARGAEARDLIRIGICQLAFLRLPAYAVVHSSVALARARRSTRPYAGLVNAVLRRASNEADALIAGQDAARLNTPRWLWDSWERTYGEMTTRAIAAAHLSEPPLDLTPAHGNVPVAELAATALPTGSLRLRCKGPISALPGYDDGSWWVQDAAAALPARLFGTVHGRRVIDLCAAPGGKTAQLCAAGAKVVAVERSAARGRQIEANLARLGLSATLVIADASTWRPAEPADAVLLDAPCSATGTIRRHPDVARGKSHADVVALATIQRSLLAAAVEMTQPGGTLIYCACSLQPEEGPEIVDAALAEGAPLRRDAIAAEEIGGLGEAITPVGDVRTLPCHWSEYGGLDGFYIARLRRTMA